MYRYQHERTVAVRMSIERLGESHRHGRIKIVQGRETIGQKKCIKPKPVRFGVRNGALLLGTRHCRPMRFVTVIFDIELAILHI